MVPSADCGAGQRGTLLIRLHFLQSFSTFQIRIQGISLSTYEGG